jgi:acyl dehydratase
VEFAIRSNDADTGEPMFTSRWRLFIRGAAGFGGAHGREHTVTAIPDAPPDRTWSVRTAQDQALVYRLSGDRNPLHSDPVFAQRAGFDRPILHGLCTYGVTGRVLLRELCGDDPERFGGLSARFSSPVFPGDELIIDAWETDHGERFRTRRPSGEVVLDEGTLLRRG